MNELTTCNGQGPDVAEWIIDALTLIQAKYDIYGRRYTDNAEDLYTRILSQFDSTFGPQAVTLCLLEQARPPDVSDLSLKHAALVSPAPDWEDAWREVFTKMQAPGRQSLSHPGITEAVADMGGLDILWHSYREGSAPLSVLRAQFQKIYEGALKSRRAQVVEIVATIGLPAGRERFPELLPPASRIADYQRAARMRYVSLPERGNTLRLPAEEHTARMKRIEAQPMALNVREFIAGLKDKLDKTEVQVIKPEPEQRKRRGPGSAVRARMEEIRKELAEKQQTALTNA